MTTVGCSTAEYLDEKYPDRPLLFEAESVKVSARFTEYWLWQTAIGPWFSCFIRDYRDLSLPQDHEYVTQTREAILGGRKLEEVQTGREDRLPLVPPPLEPLRQILKEHEWLGGRKPNYGDYRALAVFLWTASVATTPPLTEDDPLRDWLDRGFDLYGGLGRHPGMHNLFGLKLRPGDPAPFSMEHRTRLDPGRPRCGQPRESADRRRRTTGRSVPVTAARRFLIAAPRHHRSKMRRGTVRARQRLQLRRGFCY